MILATDTYYLPDNTAKVVGVLFHTWSDEAPAQVLSVTCTEVADYEPGAFYKRELPCIMALLETLPPDIRLSVLVIDGYVFLDNEGRAGLGKHLYDTLDGKVPIIGVAKTHFHNNDQLVRLIYRGESKNPLFVSSIGVPPEVAAGHIASMYGPYRMPHLLQLLDRTTKEP